MSIPSSPRLYKGTRDEVGSVAEQSIAIAIRITLLALTAYNLHILELSMRSPVRRKDIHSKQFCGNTASLPVVATLPHQNLRLVSKLCIHHHRSQCLVAFTAAFIACFVGRSTQIVSLVGTSSVRQKYSLQFSLPTKPHFFLATPKMLQEYRTKELAIPGVETLAT